MTDKIPDGMLEFNLEKALAGWPCVTRNGQEVRISFVSDLEDDKEYPLLGWIKQDLSWTFYAWDMRGLSNKDKIPRSRDLFLKKKIKTYWQNIYKNTDGEIFVTQHIYETEQKAKNSGQHSTTYLKTISFELEGIEAEPANPKTKKLWIAVHKCTNAIFEGATAATEKQLKDYMEACDVEPIFLKYWFKEIEVECE